MTNTEILVTALIPNKYFVPRTCIFQFLFCVGMQPIRHGEYILEKCLVSLVLFLLSYIVYELIIMLSLYIPNLIRIKRKCNGICLVPLS